MFYLHSDVITLAMLYGLDDDKAFLLPLKSSYIYNVGPSQSIWVMLTAISKTTCISKL